MGNHEKIWFLRQVCGSDQGMCQNGFLYGPRDGPTEIFKSELGLRQGDPLSRLLFIMGADILTRKLQAEANLPAGGIGFLLVWGGQGGGGRESLFYISFADDTMIFAKANQNTCTRVKRILDDYCAMSRQKSKLPEIGFSSNQEGPDAVEGDDPKYPWYHLPDKLGKIFGVSHYQW